MKEPAPKSSVEKSIDMVAFRAAIKSLILNKEVGYGTLFLDQEDRNKMLEGKLTEKEIDDRVGRLTDIDGRIWDKITHYEKGLVRKKDLDVYAEDVGKSEDAFRRRFLSLVTNKLGSLWIDDENAYEESIDKK